MDKIKSHTIIQCLFKYLKSNTEIFCILRLMNRSISEYFDKYILGYKIVYSFRDLIENCISDHEYFEKLVDKCFYKNSDHILENTINYYIATDFVFSSFIGFFSEVTHRLFWSLLKLLGPEPINDILPPYMREINILYSESKNEFISLNITSLWREMHKIFHKYPYDILNLINSFNNIFCTEHFEINETNDLYLIESVKINDHEVEDFCNFIYDMFVFTCKNLIKSCNNPNSFDEEFAVKIINTEYLCSIRNIMYSCLRFNQNMVTNLIGSIIFDVENMTHLNNIEKECIYDSLYIYEW